LKDLIEYEPNFTLLHILITCREINHQD